MYTSGTRSSNYGCFLKAFTWCQGLYTRLCPSLTQFMSVFLSHSSSPLSLKQLPSLGKDVVQSKLLFLCGEVGMSGEGWDILRKGKVKKGRVLVCERKVLRKWKGGSSRGRRGQQMRSICKTELLICLNTVLVRSTIHTGSQGAKRKRGKVRRTKGLETDRNTCRKAA